jgi:hypothetical protein
VTLCTGLIYGQSTKTLCLTRNAWPFTVASSLSTRVDYSGALGEYADSFDLAHLDIYTYTHLNARFDKTHSNGKRHVRTVETRELTRRS